MAQSLKVVRSAVALIEAPGILVLERRPDIPGQLACPGEASFLGGHVEPGSSFDETIIDELTDEAWFPHGFPRPIPLWEEYRLGKDKHGAVVNRHIRMYGVVLLSADDIRPNGKADLLKEERTLQAVKAINRLCEFPDDALTKHLGGYKWPLA